MLASLYHHLTSFLISRGLTAAAMESCTAGLIATLLTDTEGSSGVFYGGFVTYCNEAKILCGVPEEVIRCYGVYSPETASAMAKACRERLHTDLGIGVTGTFGNIDPANQDSRPGVVFAAVCDGDHTENLELHLPFCDSRHHYKEETALLTGKWLLGLLENQTIGRKADKT